MGLQVAMKVGGTGGGSSDVSGLPTSYLGAVATSGLIPDNVNAGAQQLMSVTSHIAWENITSLQLVFGNYYITASPALAETGTGGAMTIEASVEYPIGTYTRVTFGGSNQGSIANNATGVTDAASIVIPRGATFRVRSWYSAPSIVYCAYPNLGNLAASGVTTPNYVMGGGNPGSQAAAGYGPLAIIAQTRRPSVFLAGDSRVVGLGDSTDATLARGYFARSLPGMAYINSGRGGDRAVSAAASYTNRSLLPAYCSHVLSNFGGNDILNGSTAAQAHTALQTFFGLSCFVGKPIWQATLEPIAVTGTYTSEAGQTVGATAAAVATFNDTLRGGIAGIQGVIDVAKQVESVANPGKYLAPNGNALVGDGTHLNKRGNLVVQSAGIVTSGMFVR